MDLQVPEQLITLANRLNASSTSNDVMQIIVEAAASMTLADSSVIFLYDKYSDMFYSGARSPKLVSSIGLPRKNGLTKYIFSEEGLYYTNDASKEVIASKAMGYHKSHSFIGIRLQARKDKIGVLYVRNRKRNGFSTHHVSIMRLLAAQVSIALGGSAPLVNSSSAIRQAVNGIYSSSEVFCTISDEIRHKWNFTYVAIQLLRSELNVIETVHVSNSEKENMELSLSDLSRHSLSGGSIFDIQSEIVLSRVPLIKIISGWYEKFDRWIYDENNHEEYVRIWLPLLIVRDIDGKIVNATCRWKIRSLREHENFFDKKENREGYVTEILLDSPDQLDNSALSIEVIGTIDCGYRNKDSFITSSEALNLFEHISNVSKNIYEITLPHILNVIARQACSVTGGSSASLHYPFSTKSEQGGCAASFGVGVREFLGNCRPRPDGMGNKAINRKTPIYSGDLEKENPRVFAEDVRSMAAFPLMVSGQPGVLYLHNKTVGSFSVHEKAIELFVKQAEDAINQTSSYMSVLDSRRILGYLHNIDASLLLNPCSDRLLPRIAGIAQNLLVADVVNIYEYENNVDKFHPPSTAGQLYTGWEQETGVGVDSPARLLLSYGSDVFEADHNSPKYKKIFNGKVRSDEMSPFVVREKVVSTYGILLKVAGEYVGVMFINYRHCCKRSDETDELIRLLASSAVIAIKTKQSIRKLNLGMKRQKLEMEAFNDIDLAIKNNPTDLDSILNLILKHALHITGAKSGSIVWHNKVSNVLVMRNSIGLPEFKKNHQQLIGEGVVGKVAETLKSILVSDVNLGKWSNIYLDVVSSSVSELAVPLKDEDGLIAVLNLEHTEAYAFSEEDKVLIESFANQAVISIHTTELFEDLEKYYRSIDALRKIVTRTQKTNLSIFTILRLVLTGVTANYGLGYSRAMLFLFDSDNRCLQGYTAIGARSKQDADKIWAGLNEDSSQESSADEFDRLLEISEKQSSNILDKTENDSPLSKAVKEVIFEKSEIPDTLLNCISTKQAFSINSMIADSCRAIFRRVSLTENEESAFACVPLVGKGQNILGVMLVDRRFLFSENENNFDLKSLGMYAGVAALSVENFRLSERNMEEKRLKDLRLSTNKVRHIINSRVSSLDNVAYKLNKLMRTMKNDGSETTESLLSYGDILYQRIEKMKAKMRELGTFGSSPKLTINKFNLGELLEYVRCDQNYDCEITTDVGKDITIFGDKEKMLDVFLELVGNAKKSVAVGDDERCIIDIAARVVQYEDGFCTVIDVRDNGPGVPDDLKRAIFSPYFSGANDSSGLGLSIVKDIVLAHRGRIRETGTISDGALFTIEVPCNLDQKEWED